MSLLDIWRETPEQIEEKRLSQLISFAGDGRLRDGSTASGELRQLLEVLPAELLGRYAEDCLSESFPDSGLALQDLVNEIGTRLGFKVTPGRNRGARGTVANDGLWLGPDDHALVVEVKTSDAFRIDLETVANYRRQLITEGTITSDASSILIVVGREDTGDLEAQIRGSKHAWDIRLISIEALQKLLSVREELEDPESESRVRTVLVPREYTRVDGIIDLVFSATEDLRQEEPESEATEVIEEREAEPRKRPVSFNVACVRRISNALEIDLVKRSRATFSSPNGKHGLVCAVSKEYTDSHGVGYWFAFHPHQRDFLQEAEVSWVAFGCGSPERILLFPLAVFSGWLDGMNQTHLDNGKAYWHVQLRFDGAKWILVRRAGEDWPDVTEYELETGSIAEGAS